MKVVQNGVPQRGASADGEVLVVENAEADAKARSPRSFRTTLTFASMILSEDRVERPDAFRWERHRVAHQRHIEKLTSPISNAKRLSRTKDGRLQKDEVDQLYMWRVGREFRSDAFLALGSASSPTNG